MLTALFAVGAVLASPVATRAQEGAPAEASAGEGGGASSGEESASGGESASSDSGSSDSGSSDGGSGGSAAPAYEHTGLWLAGGFNGHAGTAGAAYFRGEVGIPLIRPGSFALGLQLPLFAGYGIAGTLTGTPLGGARLAAVPGVLAEFTVFDRWGRLAVALEAGIGIAFYGGDFGTNAGVSGVFRSGAGPRFVFPFGLLIDVRPVGVVLEVGQFGLAAAYEAGVMVGYRF